MAEEDDMQWVGTWTTAPAPIEGLALDNQTLRMIAHLSISGRSVRVRLSNAYGTRKLAVGAAHVALRREGAGIVPESDRALTFNGSPSTTIAAGALVVSHPVALPLGAAAAESTSAGEGGVLRTAVGPADPLGATSEERALRSGSPGEDEGSRPHWQPLPAALRTAVGPADLAITVYLSGDVPEAFQITGHGNAHQTNYISPPGDFTAASVMPIKETTQAFLFVSGVEVLAPPGTGGIVAFGDSLTDGNLSTLDTNNRWPDELARRLVARRDGRALGVMNQGIGGNRILHDVRGDSGLRRFDRDVLAQPGATHVIVLLGINDIRNRTQKPEEVVTAEEMIAGLHQLAVRAHARGLKIFGGTLLTFENESFNPGFYTPEGEAKRQAVNAWIREGGAFDGVIDFEAALRDPGHPTQMLPMYDCGDHLHPSDAGYRRMGEAIDLSLFD